MTKSSIVVTLLLDSGNSHFINFFFQRVADSIKPLVTVREISLSGKPIMVSRMTKRCLSMVYF